MVLFSFQFILILNFANSLFPQTKHFRAQNTHSCWLLVHSTFTNSFFYIFICYPHKRDRVRLYILRRSRRVDVVTHLNSESARRLAEHFTKFTPRFYIGCIFAFAKTPSAILWLLSNACTMVAFGLPCSIRSFGALSRIVICVSIDGLSKGEERWGGSKYRKYNFIVRQRLVTKMYLNGQSFAQQIFVEHCDEQYRCDNDACGVYMKCRFSSLLRSDKCEICLSSWAKAYTVFAMRLCEVYTCHSSRMDLWYV